MTQLDFDIQSLISHGCFEPLDQNTGMFALWYGDNRLVLWIEDNTISGFDGQMCEITDETVWMISEEFQRAISQ